MSLLCWARCIEIAPPNKWDSVDLKGCWEMLHLIKKKQIAQPEKL